MPDQTRYDNKLVAMTECALGVEQLSVPVHLTAACTRVHYK